MHSTASDTEELTMPHGTPNAFIPWGDDIDLTNRSCLAVDRVLADLAEGVGSS